MLSCGGNAGRNMLELPHSEAAGTPDVVRHSAAAGSVGDPLTAFFEWNAPEQEILP